MTTFPVHTLETVPAGARDALGRIMQSYGFVPNLAGAFAESPAALHGLLGAIGSFEAKEMTLTAVERQVVLLATSVLNRCRYCAAAHAMLAHKNGLDRGEVDGLQQGRPLADGKLEALRRFVEAVVDKRGWVSEGDLEAFLEAGFTRAQVYEVVFGVALKTLTNYANHIAKPRVNDQFAAFLPTWDGA
ncbi:MAG: hypothetical protein A3F92_01010 [Candidatus Rokubacteria bacterium RIFCSPLOWO2_12_FULL_71_22]|nr:MAG: hypothetical protein A3F92_01010 [Candidatus Rokubacteria bacterium RIFCSPLOWO2_12_FULL_71_22]